MFALLNNNAPPIQSNQNWYIDAKKEEITQVFTYPQPLIQWALGAKNYMYGTQNILIDPHEIYESVCVCEENNRGQLQTDLSFFTMWQI